MQLAMTDVLGKAFPDIMQEYVLLKHGGGLYFGHGGSNWGFQCDLVAHQVNRYGVAIMTNGDFGGQ
jgi:hypothetical protein